ncbi:isocitrate lyase/phosphoenolpyruvate mutase family protein [Actinomadura sp. KC06]|uniref:isocitrate lyase/PEP mutase family protein n=1 Tax=Actinomadura sp. KC06 TaxID=2530369 RepID=UPI0010532895|nr:isocitrate lyase/phosphoenolpyruvate mutase family protein [Actinomadura sp. KC06]TDD34963.1 isocitrate lyase/phosphoenolpyruvate mutase family protein [Actinomadura sp. KC06]
MSYRSEGRADGVAALFRALHQGPEPLVLPNAWDFASAAALVAAGFPAIGTTSLGVAAAAGKPDAEAATLGETMALAGSLARLPCPVTVDIEAGFGAPAEAADLAARLAGLGIAGINIEDGRPGRALADPAVLCESIEAIKGRVPELFVNARTDAFWLGLPAALDEALARVRMYEGAGADGVFVPKIAAKEDIAAVVAAVDVPVNVLFLPNGLAVGELAALGVRRISTGSLLFRAAIAAGVSAAEAVRDGARIGDGIPGYEEVNDLATADLSRT